MEKRETNLADCFELIPKRFGDDRGYFSSITDEELKDLAFCSFAQKSESKSVKGTFRGLHFQNDPYCQAKVVYCTQGKVLDVVVDVRRDSPTYGEYTSVVLSPEVGNMLYVPRGFAHGFLALTDGAVFNYLVDNKYMPRSEGGILWDDDNLNIPWGDIFKKYGIDKPILSDKDKNRMSLENTDIEFLRRDKKCLVTGVNGQLGHDIVNVLKRRGGYDILALSREELDITDRDNVMKIVSLYKPDFIFHCAAWTAVDKAEECKEACYDVNVVGTKNIVDASIVVGAKIIYISTDYIFDGTKSLDSMYTENDIPNPKSVYGSSKYEGEKEVLRNEKSFIARVSWVFGLNGNNFVKTMLRLSDKYSELNVVDDQIGSPTYTVDLANLLVEMAESNKYGIYNITNEGYCSWADFAQYIMDINNKNTVINRVSTDAYYEDADMSKIAYRPRNSKLDKSKLEENFYRLPTWQDAVKRYCKSLNSDKKWLLENIK